MKRIIPSLLCVLMGAISLGLLERQIGCAAGGGLGSLRPTTQQADAIVATANDSLHQAQQQLDAMKNVAATQPSNAQLAKQIADFQTRVMPIVKQGVTYANALDQAAYHDDPSALIGLTSAIPVYGPWIGFAASLVWGLWNGSKTKQALSAVADGQAALKQYAQTVHAVAPDSVVNQVSRLVDSSTRAAVADAGVVHIPDDPAANATATAPTTLGTYPLPLRPTNGAGL